MARPLRPWVTLLLFAVSCGLLAGAAPPDPKIINAISCQTEDGPPVARGEKFLPGETVFYSFQIAGYGESPIKAIRLSYRVEVFDPLGVRIAAPIESIFDATLHDEDKRWMPKLRAQIALPPVAPGGEYKIRTQVTDDISHLSTSTETVFAVEGVSLPASAKLVIRNFAFHRTEEDTRAVTAYRAGDTVFARFDIAGFRYAHDNTLGVYYDVAVLNPAGKQIYAQPHAAEDRSSSYYPKPYVPGQMSLTLQNNMRQGEYTVVLTAHDEVGDQRVESKHAFTVE